MNSRAIQERFDDVYRTFYAKCEMVCSAPTCFFWSGDSLIRYGIPAIVQKLPLRVHVGVESSDHQGATWGTFRMYDPQKDLFVDYDCQEPALQRVIYWINNMMGEGASGLIHGTKIHILSETLFGAGATHAATITGAFMSSLAACLMIRGLELTAEQIEDCCRQGRGPLFENLFGLARKLTLETGGGHSLWNGADVYCALVPSPYPQFYVAEAHVVTAANHGSASVVPYPRSYDDIENTNYCGFGLVDLTMSAPPWHWPFDFGLLYTGLPKRTHDAIHSSLSLPLAMKDFAEWYQTKMAPSLSFRKQLLFTSRARPAQLSAKIWQNQVEPAAMISLHLLFTLVSMFDRGYSEDRMQSLARDMNRYHCYLQLLDLCDQELDDIRHRLIRAAPPGIKDRVGAKLSGAGKGGGLICASPSGALPDFLPHFVEKLRSEGLNGARLEYASWVDGYEGNGLMVEQCARENIFSANLGREYARAILWDGIGKPQIRLLGEGELPQIVESYDLVALLEERAIYVAGEQIKGRDGLHSARYTAKLLHSLLSNPALKLSAEQMPDGYCYSFESFELQGKIVNPLRRIIQERTRKNLELKVISVQKRVHLQLAPCGVRICVVDSR
jgi:mevalonate kinase